MWDTQKTPREDGYMLRIVLRDHSRSTRDGTSSPIQLTHEDSHPPHAQVLVPDAGGLPKSSIVAWSAEDPDGDPLTVDVGLQSRKDEPWRELATGLYDAGEYLLDSPLSTEEMYQLRVRARDSTYRSEALSPPFAKSVPTKQLPDVTLEIPPGRDAWSGTEEIRWQASDPSRQNLTLRIEISRDGGRTWNTLERRLENTGFYAWDTTSHPNGPCMLRLTADNARFEITKVSHPFVLRNPGNALPTVSLVSPRGGERWSGIQEIKWLARDGDGDSLRVDLAYRIGGDSTWRTLANSVPNTGRYLWDTVSVPNCDTLWVRVTASDDAFMAQDEMHIPFEVNNSHTPLTELMEPRGGTELSGRRKIRWVTAQETQLTQASIRISTDAGNRWQTLASDLPPTGVYLWDTSAVPNGTPVWLRVIANEYTQEAIDTSPEPVIVLHERLSPRLPFYLH